MKLKWQWFLGGRVMFWISIILFIVLALSFTFCYITDPFCVYTEKTNADNSKIKEISEEYVKSLRC